MQENTVCIILAGGIGSLLSTVHWVCSTRSLASDEEILAAVYAWSERKRQFTPRQVKISTDVLRRKHWIN